MTLLLDPNSSPALRTWSNSFYLHTLSIPPSDFLSFLDSLPTLYPYISKQDCLIDCFYLPQFINNYPNNFYISFTNYCYCYVNDYKHTNNLEKLIKQPTDKLKLTIYVQPNKVKIPCWTFLLDSNTPPTFKAFTPPIIDTKPKPKRTRKPKSN